MLRKIPLVPGAALIAFIVIFVNFLLFVWMRGSYYSTAPIFFMFLFDLVIFIAICFGAWQMKSLKAAGRAHG